MLEAFHFIRPWWLVALLPLALLVWQVMAGSGRGNVWRNVVDERLMPLLQVGQAGAGSHQIAWLLAVGWLLATLALADPTWQRRPQPVFQTKAARVVVLDLSNSMNAVDLKPSRLVRARYKVEDVLAQPTEGQTGLVAYAGGAFTVSPLTRDTNTIRSLLKVLEPALMPTPGGRADLGLAKAGELLHQAGLTSGQVLLIADGVDANHASATNRAAVKLHEEGYTVSVLGIGTEAGAPLVGERGALERDASGTVLVSRLDVATLESVAHSGGGAYRTMSNDGAALHALLAADQSAQRVENKPAAATASAWKEQGPLIVLFLLPLAALAFRRNWLLGISLAATLALPVQSVEAATWRDAWQRPDQQAAHALVAGDYAKAAKVAADPALRGSADYKLGDYQRAIDDFGHASGADADYNRGNALARLGRYQDAIVAYDKSIAERPVNDDARANKAAVEALLKRQPPPPQDNKPSKDGDGQKQQSGGKGDDKGNNKGNGTSNRNGNRSAKADDPNKGQGSSSTSGGGQQGRPQQSPDQPGMGSTSSSQPSGSGSASANQGTNATAQLGQSAQQPGQSGQQSAGSLTPSQGPSDRFAQAVKKVGASSQGEKDGTSQVAKGLPDVGRSDSGDTSQAGGNSAARSTSGAAVPLESEERLAAEQWLRRIPDDPGGLLRRKFLYQYRQRQQQGAADDQ